MKSDHIFGKRKVGTFHIPSQNAKIPNFGSNFDHDFSVKFKNYSFYQNFLLITYISQLGHRVIQILKQNILFKKNLIDINFTR